MTRKIRNTLIVGFLALAVAPGFAQALGNVAPNGGFENGTGGIPDHWSNSAADTGFTGSFDGSSYCSVAQSSTAYSGSHSLAVTHASGQRGSCGAQSDAFSVSAGTAYRVTVMTRDAGPIDCEPEVVIDFQDASGNWLGWTMQGSALWQGHWLAAYPFTATAPAGAVTATVWLEMYDEGSSAASTCLFDDLVVTSI
ncbi:MAG: hypothetical protein QOE90_1241 [Thermoplasmata archaeon]|jgi:hypothetical protein|nr:hypothetical protein [Thermoplasmata archaeon]